MAKYTFIFGCGHEDTIELFGKGNDRELTIEYIKQYGMCKSCYAEQKRREDKEMGLVLKIALEPMSVEAPIVLIFEGDTLPNKDKIKELKYRFDDEPPIGALGFLSIGKRKKVWQKNISIDFLQKEIDVAKAMALKSKINNEKIVITTEQAKMLNSYLAETEVYDEAVKNINNNKKKYITIEEIKERIAEEKARKQAEKEKFELPIAEIPKPVIPEFLDGKSWNGNYYGKEKNMVSLIIKK